MNPTTYEDGARRAITALLSLEGESEPSVEGMWQAFEQIEKLDFCSSSPSAECANRWASLGAMALGFYAIPIDIESMVGVLLRNNSLYGNIGIMRFGRHGIVIRMFDSIREFAALWESYYSQPGHRSIDRILLNIITYAALGIMWEHEWFGLPPGQ